MKAARLFSHFIILFLVSLFSCPSNKPYLKDEIRILSFNVLYGGDEYDFSKTIEAIKKSGAQVACIQEAEGQLERIAKALGWPYFNKAGHIISQYPLYVQPGKAWFYTLVELHPGRFFALSNVHLPSDPYGPEAVRDGMLPKEVMALEKQTRLPMLNLFQEHWDSLLKASIPLVVTGDFNSPSHLDWVETCVADRPQLNYAFAWPATLEMAKLGFNDHYRSLYPDPHLHPGCTWTPGYPFPKLNPGETHDRIDYIFGSADIQALEVLLVGEKGNPAVSIPIDPYPSDHRGVLSRMRILIYAVEPGPIACNTNTKPQGKALIQTNLRTYSPGAPIEVSWKHAPGNRYDWVAVYPLGKDSRSDYYATDQNSAYLLWAYTYAQPNGVLTLNADAAHAKQWPLPPGQYSVHLLLDDGFESIAETTINIH